MLDSLETMIPTLKSAQTRPHAGGDCRLLPAAVAAEFAYDVAASEEVLAKEGLDAQLRERFGKLLDAAR
jgi:hypothetical protein